MQTTRRAVHDDARKLLELFERTPNGSIIIQEDHDWLPRIFGKECTRIRQELRKGEAESVTQLAKRLQRDRTAVQKDLVFLEVLGLVERRREGKAVAVRGVERVIVVMGEVL